MNTTFKKTITESDTKKEIHRLVWATNFNNKLDCKAFFHLELIKERLPRHHQNKDRIYLIETADGSHAPVRAIIYDILPFQLKHISDFHCMSSHGQTAIAFTNDLFNLYGETLTFNHWMALYYFFIEENAPSYDGI